MALILLIVAGCLLAASGVPALLLPWRSVWGPRIATLAILLGASVGILGCAAALGGGTSATLDLASGAGGLRLTLGVDALSAFFAVPLFVVGALGSVYGLAYWTSAEHPRNGRRLRFGFGLLLAAMLFVTLARNAASFLVAWEVMALCGYFLVTTDSRSAEVRDAGWLYLVYSHAGTLAIAGCFAVLAHASGDFALRALAPGEIGRGFAFAAFGLALFGFGIKAGAMPLHSWLPAAHASAPSHVSAVMSGVLLKMGVYGLLRTTAVLPPGPIAWGAAVLVLGALSASLAIAFALGQCDLKRLLAYSSIENIGIILLGLGLALVGRSTGRADWVVLGMAGCLFHVWNHALFKSLLFFGAGAVVHETGSRDLERMGGLARRMPATAALFLVGAVAICGLPPFNGFASELLVYLGLVRAGGHSGTAWAALPAPVLAATGALAVACFVKVVGIVFLGEPRTAAAGAAHEPPASDAGADGGAGRRLPAARRGTESDGPGAGSGDRGLGGRRRGAAGARLARAVRLGERRGARGHRARRRAAARGAPRLPAGPLAPAGAADLGLRLRRRARGLAAAAVHRLLVRRDHHLTLRLGAAAAEHRPRIERIFPGPRRLPLSRR